MTSCCICNVHGLFNWIKSNGGFLFREVRTSVVFNLIHGWKHDDTSDPKLPDKCY